MSVDAQGTPGIVGHAPPTNPEDHPRASFWAGRSGLLVPGILAAIGTYLSVGIATMDVPEGAKAPGPTFFPIIITIAIFVLAAVLSFQMLRHPAAPPPDAATYRLHSDWKSLGLVFGAFLAFALLMVPAGWILSAALLFWCVSRALGSRRPLFDLGLSLVFSSFIQLAFGAGLGLSLPGGILEGIYG